jgi:hypothetical protein
MVAWLTPKMAPTVSRVVFLRIGVPTIAGFESRELNLRVAVHELSGQRIRSPAGGSAWLRTGSRG